MGGLISEIFVGAACFRGRGGYTYFGEDFVFPQGSGEGVDKELVGMNSAGATLAGVASDAGARNTQYVPQVVNQERRGSTSLV